MLLEQKDKQIKDLQEQIAFLKVTIQDKVKSEERLQQIILSQNILQQPKLSVWQRMRSIFGNNQEHYEQCISHQEQRKLQIEKELVNMKSDDSDKHSITYECLSQIAMMFLELASEKAFELLDGFIDAGAFPEEELEKLEFFFVESKISLLAS